MECYKVVARPSLLYGSETCVTTQRHDWPRSCRDAISKKCYRINKTGQNKKRRHKTRTRDLWNTRRETQIRKKTGSITSKEWTTPDSRNTPSPTNPGEEGIADAPGKRGNASMPEQVKRPNPWRKMMMIMMMKMTNWNSKFLWISEIKIFSLLLELFPLEFDQ